LASELRTAFDSADDAAGKASALFDIRAVFDANLAENAVFRDAVIAALAGLLARGSQQSVEEFVA
jgi:mannitol-1-phosphate/altronate dehydrogenase